ncbi:MULTISPECIES: hypothetical protein [Actinomadura]|nr:MULTISPECIES: hypothetical protein [Actinomadura]
MFIVGMVVIGLVGLLASLAYLAEFARASRRDALFLPAPDGRSRRARRVTGMYTRGSDFMDGDDEIRGDELVGR